MVTSCFLITRWNSDCNNRLNYRSFVPQTNIDGKSSTLSAAYHKHEQEKHRTYKERVREVEHGYFTPSTSGGMGKPATVVYKHLANLLSIRSNVPYPLIMGWVCCTLNFSLLKSSIMCICGSRSSSGHLDLLLLVLAESRVSTIRNLPL